MINEVDEALRNLVKADVVNGSDIEVLFDAPTREWASRRNTPTVDLYLYDIREDVKRRQTGLMDRRDEQGVVVERRQPPRFFKLAYLITAWTQRPEDRQVSDVWTSLGGDLKPSLDLVITVIIEDDTLHDIAQAVMAPLRLKAVGHTTYDVEDGVRHLPDGTVNGSPTPVPRTASATKGKSGRNVGQKGS